MIERGLSRLADAVSRRRRAVFAVWIALLAGGAWFSLHQSDHLSGGGWEVPGSASIRVVDAVERDFPQSQPPTFLVLASNRRALEQAVARVRGERAVRVGKPVALRDGSSALLPLSYTGKTSGAIDEATRLRHLLVDDHTKVIGEPAIWSNFQDVSKQQLARGEAIGFPLILLILLAAFGTVVAAVAPLALGFAAVFLTGAVIYLLSRSVEISVYVTNMASMIGIGVAVDYSLFIVSRFRRELHGASASREEALRRALSSSGTAVVFSGATVAVSLGALFAIDVNALRSMAIGAIVVVCISVLASITLLPALLAATGTRIDRLRLPLPWRTSESGSDAFWSGWARRVMRHPVAGLAAGAGLMLVLAVPFFWMQTFNRGLDELPRNAEVRVATLQAQRLTGPGFASPVHVVTDDPSVARAIARVPGVVRVAPPVRGATGQTWLVDATLAYQAETAEAQRAVRRIEQVAGPGSIVGGSTVFARDVTDAVFGGLWKMLLFILAACYVVLFVLLRSAVLPLKAVAMNLLSVGAAYGVLVAVFQWGWLDWTGYDSPGYVETIVPALVLAVTFGLSMDYEVFLLTRVRERWLEHGDNELAVAEGLTLSARIITSAALVMVAVFFAFVVAGAPSLKELGAGLGVAILLDATVVRLLIVPAAMRLLGAWNWWLPARLARLLPAASH
ncbi:MAG TPA: MMPL family transporter [Gaiellaceae bacterium]|nr:MMPL family transporter [Gaiellaceae bacterium]